MGGSSKSSAPATVQKDISNAAIRPMTQVPAAMPDQLDALSQQLAMGYGGQPSDLLALMNQYYQPMQLPNYAPNAVPVVADQNSTQSGGVSSNKGLLAALNNGRTIADYLNNPFGG